MLRSIAIAAGLAIVALPASALTVEVKSSDAFQEKLADDYGVKEANRLQESLATKIEAAFNRKSVTADRVSVVIEDARPNRPTFQQLSDRLGLDPIHSFGTGGARVTGTAYDASGAEIGTLDYDWYETDISQSVGVSTWHDARWAFDRFARRFADTVG